MNLVIDASVAVKWFFPNLSEEENTSEAVSILQGVGLASIVPVQPIHWMAEVISVVARINFSLVNDAIELLDAMEFDVVDEPYVYKVASTIAQESNQHLFDTLYHAVALTREINLVTADLKYFKNTRSHGGLLRLDEWTSEC